MRMSPNIEEIFVTRKRSRESIKIAEEYFKDKKYLSSFVVLLFYIEFTSLCLFESIRKEKVVRGEKGEISHWAEKRLENNSLGKETLGQLIGFIKTENNPTHPLPTGIIEKLEEINKLRIKYIHLLGLEEITSARDLETRVKNEIDDNKMFDFARQISDIGKEIRGKTQAFLHATT